MAKKRNFVLLYGCSEASVLYPWLSQIVAALGLPVLLASRSRSLALCMTPTKSCAGPVGMPARFH